MSHRKHWLPNGADVHRATELRKHYDRISTDLVEVSSPLLIATSPRLCRMLETTRQMSDTVSIQLRLLAYQRSYHLLNGGASWTDSQLSPDRPLSEKILIVLDLLCDVQPKPAREVQKPQCQ